MHLYPMKLNPVLKDIIWGGTRLASDYGKSENKNQKIAESWELAVHKNGVSTIENGEYAGKTLEELFLLDKSIVSPGYKSDRFPLLVKFIDAAENLSVQVHPDDAYAAKHENESGKTEMWYIMDALPGAKIVYGLNGDYTREQLQTLIDENRFESCLNYKEVYPGEVYFIPAGLVHAIGEGILVLEIQQNSDSTYRFYDYNRPRELHIDKALDVCIKTKTEYENPVTSPLPGWEELLVSEYFRVKKFCGLSALFEPVSMHCVVCVEGEGKIIHKEKIYDIKKGESYFFPAGMGSCKIENKSYGSAVFVIAHLNN